MVDHDNWKEHSVHVISELRRLDKSILTLNSTVVNCRVEIAQLKIKSGVWGAIGAVIILAPAVMIYFITKT